MSGSPRRAFTCHGPFYYTFCLHAPEVRQIPKVGGHTARHRTDLLILLSASSRMKAFPSSHPGRHLLSNCRMRVIYWMPEFAATSLNRYSDGDDGTTAEQLRTGRSWHRPAIAVEAQWRDGAGKETTCDGSEEIESRFVRGHFIILGHVSRSATALVMMAQGIFRGIGLSRLAEDERWKAA
eukprot:4719042-Amphidinium_carterae.1